jgi:hypothetical protein
MYVFFYNGIFYILDLLGNKTELTSTRRIRASDGCDFNKEDYFYEFTILVHLAIFGRKLRGGGRGRSSRGGDIVNYDTSTDH